MDTDTVVEGVEEVDREAAGECEADNVAETVSVARVDGDVVFVTANETDADVQPEAERVLASTLRVTDTLGEIVADVVDDGLKVAACVAIDEMESDQVTVGERVTIVESEGERVSPPETDTCGDGDDNVEIVADKDVDVVTEEEGQLLPEDDGV